MLSYSKPVTERLKPAGIPHWRKDSASLFGQIEAKGDSELFKSENGAKPRARRWNDYFSEEATKRKPSDIKAAARTASSQPDIISLNAGAPSGAYFPFEEVNVRLSDHPGQPNNKRQDGDSVIKMAKYDFESGVSDYSLDVALNYGQGTGSAQMLRFVTEHTEVIHSPPYADWGCCLTVGSTSAWDTTLRLFCEKGDYIIVEQYAFASALETAWPLGVKTLSVGMDEQGLIPESLNALLSNWDESERKTRRPFLLYMVPTGQNPTGATQSFERRWAIYGLARKFELYIVEDEPYYHLQMPPFKDLNSDAPSPSSNGDGCELIPSYLSLDVDGRVLRMDSVSKVLAPGSRMGWVTASQQVIEKFIRQNETSAQNASGFSQVIIYKLLNHHWGHLGFLKWLEAIQAEYTWRRDTFAQARLEFLPESIASWKPPQAGMFQWIEINWKTHPSYKTDADHHTIQQAILASAVDHKVFLTPGTCFWSDVDGAVEERMFFRATFASASRDYLRKAARRFGDALRSQFL